MDLLEPNLLLSSTISDAKLGAKFVSADKLDYAYDAGSPPMILLETNLLLSSTLGARLMSADIEDLFLCSKMDEPENMNIHSRYLLEDIRQNIISNH